MLVLPWHSKKAIMKGEKKYLNEGGKLIFPLPEIEIVGEIKQKIVFCSQKTT